MVLRYREWWRIKAWVFSDDGDVMAKTGERGEWIRIPPSGCSGGRCSTANQARKEDQPPSVLGMFSQIRSNDAATPPMLRLVRSIDISRSTVAPPHSG